MDIYVKVFATCDKCGKTFPAEELYKKNLGNGEFADSYFCKDCYDKLTGARFANAPRHTVEVVFCEDCPMYSPYNDGKPHGSCEFAYRTVFHNDFCDLGLYYSEKYAKEIAEED